MQAFHVAAFIKHLQGGFTPPTVKQNLSALRMLFDWLVTGHVLDVNPAHAVRGPKYVVKKGKTPVLTADEARELLQARVDCAVIALWLGRESVDTTQIYLEATLAMKEAALRKTPALPGTLGRYRPDDHLLRFLKGL